MPQKGSKYLQGAGIERRFAVFAGRLARSAARRRATW
jgi:hypothetical protein